MNLTPKQMKILQLFMLQGQMGIMRLATLMQCEKALARNMVDELVNLGLLVRYENTQYNISAAGKMALPGARAETVAAERKAKKIPSGSTKFEVIKDEQKPEIATEAVHSVPAAEPANDEATHPLLQPDPHVTAMVDVVTPFVDAVNETVDMLNQALKPEPAKPTFDDLVLAGLNRLSEQLHFSPVPIEHKRRKLSTLTKLAEAVSMFDKPVAEVLYAIAADLKKLPEVKHG